MPEEEKTEVTPDPHADAVLSEEHFSNRQDVYAELNAMSSDEETVAEDNGAAPEEDAQGDLEPEDQDTEVPSEEEQTEEEESPEEESEEKKQKKMVALEALHESRAQTKEAKDRINTLESQLSEVISGYKEAMAPKVAPIPEVADDEPIDDIDSVVRQLVKRVQQTEAGQADTVKKQEETAQEVRAKAINAQIAKADAELSQEGFPGFSEMEYKVADEMRAISDDDERAAAFNDPEEWKRIYKEKTYPTYSGIFAKKARKDKFDQKKVNAENASLNGGSRKVKKAAKKEKSNNYSDYLEMRAKNQVF